ncbi:hypothetical protein ACQR05_01080 [Bradyrhizobium oligotrophicum]|uniref:hypothetical protein n=1 Tax=Bradyrhizobium oligotrophicum TaxID=44255 RepID=UPI003EBA5927
MSAKLRIKAKGIEIEWEGEVEFLKSEVPGLIASIIDAIGAGTEDVPGESGEDPASGSNGHNTNKFTTASAAARLKARSAAELFKAALLKLQISDGIEPATRAQIHDEMKLAPRVYKPTMQGNLSKTIASLMDQGEINEPVSGSFVLSDSMHEQLLQRINS